MERDVILRHVESRDEGMPGLRRRRHGSRVATRLRNKRLLAHFGRKLGLVKHRSNEMYQACHTLLEQSIKLGHHGQLDYLPSATAEERHNSSFVLSFLAKQAKSLSLMQRAY